MPTPTGCFGEGIPPVARRPAAGQAMAWPGLAMAMAWPWPYFHQYVNLRDIFSINYGNNHLMTQGHILYEATYVVEYAPEIGWDGWLPG